MSNDDHINHPPHYTAGSIECIEALEAALSPEEFAGYCKGAAMKYIWRQRRKGGVDDLKKAIWYMSRVVERSALSEALLTAISAVGPGEVVTPEPKPMLVDGRPNWAVIPQWVEFAAQDGNGQWFGYMREPLANPVMERGFWQISEGGRISLGRADRTPYYWRDTLEARPSDELPDWDEYPLWVRWRAQDASGGWWGYAVEPKRFDEIWSTIADDRRFLIAVRESNFDGWRGTLEARP